MRELKPLSPDWQHVMLRVLGSDDGRIPSLRRIHLDDGRIVLTTGPDAPKELPGMMRSHNWHQGDQRNPLDDAEHQWYYEPNSECCPMCEIALALIAACESGYEIPEGMVADAERVSRRTEPEPELTREDFERMLESGQMRIIRIDGESDADISAAVHKAMSEIAEEIVSNTRTGKRPEVISSAGKRVH